MHHKINYLSDLRRLLDPPVRRLEIFPGLRSADSDPVTSGCHPDRPDQPHGQHLLHRRHGPGEVLRRLPPVSAPKVSPSRRNDSQ